MSRELKAFLFGSVGLLVVAVGLYASLFTLGVLPKLGFSPGYSLQDASGSRLTSEDFRGKVTLYTFTSVREQRASRDPDLVLREVQEMLRTEETGGIPVRLVTIVLDPPAGDPAAVAAVAARAGAEDGRWHVASGADDDLRTVVRDGFGVWYEKGASGDLRFDPVFVLVDGMGIVRARHRVGLPDASVLLDQVRSVVREANAADGPSRLAYSAAHLFQCYPS